MSKISFESFVKEFAKDLEIADYNYKEELLKDIPEYDSMGKITVSFTIERLFNFQIEYEVLDNTNTLIELYDYCVSK